MDVKLIVSIFQQTADKIKLSEGPTTSEAQHIYNQGFIQAMDLTVKTLQDLAQLEDAMTENRRNCLTCDNTVGSWFCESCAAKRSVLSGQGRYNDTEPAILKFPTQM